MTLAAYEYKFTPSSGSAVTISYNTRFQERPGPPRLALWSYPGVDGEDGLKLGKTGRRATLEAWFHDSTEANVRTSMAALDTLVVAASVCTVEVRGTAATWSNVIIEAVEYGEHYVDPLGYFGQQLRLSLRQLIPD